MSQADDNISIFLKNAERDAHMAQIDRLIIARAADWLCFGANLNGLSDWGARRLLDYPSIVWG